MGRAADLWRESVEFSGSYSEVDGPALKVGGKGPYLGAGLALPLGVGLLEAVYLAGTRRFLDVQRVHTGGGGRIDAGAGGTADAAELVVADGSGRARAPVVAHRLRGAVHGG